ncbi:MAG: arginine--tRNA ligase [Alphaproteobacteria bacterium]|nr:arginine--tRNA ligase [Alphaproteobacteria bacterium]MBN2780314.1 arginine--tRNA ligase [Alphaproteobacteria bacterium]
MLEKLTKKIKDAFAKAGYETDVTLGASNRPELSDFQCNDALRLAKQLGKNPQDIAAEIARHLEEDPLFESVSVDGPGFLNFKMTDAFWVGQAQALLKDDRLGIPKTAQKQKIVIDYGGPNVAKPLHAGHLRSAVIGESIKQILRFSGHNVIGDVHFGDWGLQMGLVSSEIDRRRIARVYFDKSFTGKYPTQAPVTMAELSEIYPTASARAKEDDVFKKKAQTQTLRLQNGERGLRALWQHNRDTSMESIKKSYETLGVKFDLWMGEADVHDRSMDLIEKYKKAGKLEESDGAYVISVKEETDKKEMPPVLVLKSNGSVGYHTTDIATVDYRIKELAADKIIYVTDDRQKLHFEQLFRAVKKLKMVPEDFPFYHVAYGTMNGTDGKPFKTRAGGVLRLEDMIDLLQEAGMKCLADREGSDSWKEAVSRQVGVAALKFGDLINPPRSDYVLDLEAFTKFEGKTGPYIQYTGVRIQSVLKKAKDEPVLGDALQETEKELIQKIFGFQKAFELSAEKYSPHYLCMAAFEISQAFNAFYHACPILNEESKAVRSHRLALCHLTLKSLLIFAKLIGIEIPEKM